MNDGMIGLPAGASRDAGALRWQTALPWMALALVVVLAGAAAFVGVRLGVQQAQTMPTTLSDRIYELIGTESELSEAQKTAIGAIDGRYAPQREALRLRSRAANVRMLEATSREQQFGTDTQAALDQLQLVMGERLKLSMAYMLEIRNELTPIQRDRFDRNVAEAAAQSR